ncbi:hypothetical protein SDC49_09860 [Lactobacillus sp. R2/2]|nr:hypothetical protein [Lactobacillus sp. R2/2]
MKEPSDFALTWATKSRDTNCSFGFNTIFAIVSSAFLLNEPKYLLIEFP